MSGALLPVVWVTHPRHLPPPPASPSVAVDVAFAAGLAQFEKKTQAFIDKLGEHLVGWIDHHEHPEAWARFVDDPRFVLVPNQKAHACPELITPAVIAGLEERAGKKAETVLAHADFDGALSAVKWMRGGHEPWPDADEDARHVDSPGRGHTITAHGRRLALALDEVSATSSREARCEFLDRMVRAIVRDDVDVDFSAELDALFTKAEAAEVEAARIADAQGREEAQGVYVVRVKEPLDNRMRRNLLVEAEQRAPIGALYEPDKEAGHWLTAATFDQGLDLARVPGFKGGRSDYRFARAIKGGKEQVAALATYLMEAGR